MLLCSLACWQRQGHDILRPRIPNYTISGYTVDLDDTTLALPFTPIDLWAKAMLYEVTFDPVSIISDTNGYYQIDSVYPGIYVIEAARSGYGIFARQFDMGHADMPFDLELPTPLVSNRYYSGIGGQNPRFAWGPDGLYYFGTLRIPPEGVPFEIIPVIYRGRIDQQRIIKDRRYDNPFPGATCFIFVEGLFYLQSWDTLAVLPAIDLSFVTTTKLEDPFHGLAWDGQGFWSTFERALQYRGQQAINMERSWEVDSGRLGPLVKSRNWFWSYDRDQHLILKMNQQGQVLLHLIPFDGNTGYGIGVHDMDIGYDGNLWVSGGAGIYGFDVE
jgi:hypothetical protein